MIVDAAWLARSWLSVYAAASNDSGRPVFYRTVHVEEFRHGLRLSATDSYMLLESWVPERDFEGDDPPGRDEVPELAAVACDEHGRAANLLTHLLKLATDKGAKPIDVRVRLGVVVAGPDGEDALTFDGMDATAVVIDHPEHERVQLDISEFAYPSFAGVFEGWKPVRTDGIALNPVLVAKLAKVAKLHGDENPLKWRWGGINKAARIEMGTDDASLVTGLVMPMRWDFDRNAPYGEPEPDE